MNKYADERLHPVIAAYNKFREEYQGVIFSTSELKTEFEKRGIPFNYHYLPSYIRFEIVIKLAKNQYILRPKVTHKSRLANAWKETTKRRKNAA